MKKLFMILLAVGFLTACGGGASKEEASNDDAQELTSEQEEELATSLATEIQEDTEEVKKATEENLEEIDSLLENF